MTGSRPRRRSLRAGVLTAVAAAVMVIAAPAAADPPTVPDGGDLPEPTAGVESITAADGDVFFFLPVDRGRRWFPLCPNGDPPEAGRDVCGGTGTGDKVYGGRTFLSDPADARCVVVAAHNDTVRPADVVLPRKCYRLPLMFAVASAAMLDSVAETLRQSVGSCAQIPQAGQLPATPQRCGNLLDWWPRHGGTGALQCERIQARWLPPEVAAYTTNGQDTARLREVCAVLDSYLIPATSMPSDPTGTGPPDTGPVPPTGAALALSSSAFDLYARGAGRAPVQRLLDLGLFTINLTQACANGNRVACGLDKSAAVVDCAADAMGCISRWLANGATSAVRLLGEVIAAPPAVDVSDPAFRSIYQPLGVTSAYLALLLLMVSGITSIATLDYAGIARAVLGVFRYALGLAALLTLTVTALDVAHTISVGIAGDEASLRALTTRFQQAIQDALLGDAAPTAFVALLAVLVLLAAAFTWLIMYGRKAAILIICAFSPLLLAGQAGPQWARAWAPRAIKMLAAVIFAQPVAAVFYRLGVGLMALSPGLGNVVTGVIILMMVGFSPWVLLAFIGLTTQMLASEQTRARGGHGGAGLTASSMAAMTMRANSPARTAALTTAGAGAAPRHATGADSGGAHAALGAAAGAAGTPASAGRSAAQTGRGWGGSGALAAGVMVASAAQQVGAHLADQVATAGGATGDAPRGPQLAHAATIGAHRAPAAPAGAARAVAPAPSGGAPAGGALAPAAGLGEPSPRPVPPMPYPPPQPPPEPPEPELPQPAVPQPPVPQPDTEPLAPAAESGWAVPR
jgi:type IV secretion system protein TrbL